MIVLWPYLTKYLDPFNVMGVQLVQKGLLINNFKVTSINKQVVPTIVKLCRIVHRIVHDCALTVSHKIFVPIQCYGPLINNFTFTSINNHVVNTIVGLCKIVLWLHLAKFLDFGGCWPKSHGFLQGLVWGGGLGCLIIVPPQHKPIIKCGAAWGFPPYLQVVQKYCRCNKTRYLKKKIKSILNGNGLSQEAILLRRHPLRTYHSHSKATLNL